jgi:hypothetical protein
LLRQLSPLPAPGGLAADAAPLLVAPREIALRAIGALVAQVAGPCAPPRLERLERLGEALLQALARRRRFAATLAGTKLALSAKGRLSVTREGVRSRGKAPD